MQHNCIISGDSQHNTLVVIWSLVREEYSCTNMDAYGKQVANSLFLKEN